MASLVILFSTFTAPTSLADIQAEWQFDLEADLNQPSAVRVSSQGKAYVLDGLNGRVVIFDRDGNQVGVFSAPPASPLSLPMDLQLFQDQVIVADSGNHRLLIFNAKGDYQQALPLSSEGLERQPEPTGLAIIDGVVYWSDRANSRICATELQTGDQLRCWGEFGTHEGEFRYPFMLSTDKDNYLYIVDVLNGRIQVFNERGRSFGALERFGVKADSLLRPNGISLEKHEYMLVSDAYSGNILQFNGRSFAGMLKDQGGNAVQFDQPVGIERWRDRLYVVEMSRHRVRVLRIEKQENQAPDPARAYFSQPIRRDCVTCHLGWSEQYKLPAGEVDPAPPEGTKRMCMSCHHGAVIDSRMSLGSGAQHPDYYHPLKDDYFNDDVEREDQLADSFPMLEGDVPYCGSCHTPHRFGEEETGLGHGHENLWMRDTNQDSKICSQCHESLYAEGEEAARKMGVHPVSINLEEPVEIAGTTVERLNCHSCHRAHGGKQESALLVVSNENIGELCAACHERHHADSLKQARRKGVHPLNVELEQVVNIADREITQVDCLSCHSVHGGIAHTPSLIVDDNDGQLCESCHEDSLAVIDTDHDLRLSASESHNLLEESPETAGVCGTCHSMHRGGTDYPYLSVGDELPEDADSSHLARDRLCMGCHREQGIGEKRVIEDYTHPYQDLVMHSDLESMPLLDAEEKIESTGQIACITCHDPHTWSPRHSDRPLTKRESTDRDEDGTVLDSFLRREQIQNSFCVDCHGLETRIKYKFYHDQRGRPDKAKYLR
jgi:predicted CXXCH cytochrome family protein